MSFYNSVEKDKEAIQMTEIIVPLEEYEMIINVGALLIAAIIFYLGYLKEKRRYEKILTR